MNNATAYQLGIIFSIGSYNKEDARITFRHKERYFLEQLQTLFPNTIYGQEVHSGKQYVMKASINIETLDNLNWNARNSDVRKLPILEKYKDFLRAYLEIHSRFDYCTTYTGNRKYYRLRLRIYGNFNIIENINSILAIEVKTKKKSIYTTPNGKTSVLCYTNLEEIRNILKYLDGSPFNNLFWDNAYRCLNEPKKYIKN
ncbi:hypothetical protein HAHI6034_11790 [Hathewaya histolytica]|uniref:Homing endonuclease LAGLIDADG domain-containing protein n=1 Tax=Hathewaya histolytica TaxID=1498 RepID=A0A4U9RB69_HATHI|nr:hypothetical protein [Hathewaya histolytica]VTQ88874.1 Uncharacterised protein [Hathewaya histolytica]